VAKWMPTKEKGRFARKNSLVENRLKAHTDQMRFGNATRIFSFQNQIKPSTDKNFTRYADQIAKIA
jgi:hypothetical protein